MSAYAGAIFLVVGFIVLIKVLGLAEKAIRVVQVSKQAFRDLSDPALDDMAKEAAMKGHSKTLGWLSVLVSLGTVVALIAPATVIGLLDALGVLSFDAVMTVALSWEFILGGTVLMVAVFWVGGRWRRDV